MAFCGKQSKLPEGAPAGFVSGREAPKQIFREKAQG
jgi:hypothetical protein